MQARQTPTRSALRELSDDVLDHHHGGIDQHADGDRQSAERHQIGRESELLHQDEGGQRRQRQDQRHGQGRARIAEKEHQQHDDQDRGLDQRLGDGMDRALDQHAAVVEDIEPDALGQTGRQFIELGLDAVDQGARIGAAQRQHQRLDRLALTIAGHGAIAGQGREPDLGDIGHAHRLAGVAADHDRPQVVERLDGAGTAHQQDFLAFVEPAGAVVAVVGRDGLAQLVQTEAARREPRIVRHHLEGGHETAERVDVGHAGHRTQGGTDGPVEQVAPLGETERTALDAEHEHLAQGRGHGRDPAFDALGQIAPDAVEPLGDLLACPDDVGPFGEVDGDVGERVLGDRAQHGLTRQTQHLDLDQTGDARGHFLGRHARRLDDDLDLSGRDVGKGVDGRELNGAPAAADEQRHDQQHQ